MAQQCWGMTETSPVGTTGNIPSMFDSASEETRINLRSSIGQPMPYFNVRIVGNNDKILAWDGATSGELQVNWRLINQSAVSSVTAVV